MIKIQIKATGEIREVTKNVAYDLIDRGIAVLAGSKPPVGVDRQEDKSRYLDRQMRSFRKGLKG